MKRVLIFLSLVASIQCLTDEKINQLKKFHLECFEETQVNPNLILKLSEGNWFIENRGLKQWILCLLRKFNLMSTEGVFKLDTALAMVPQRDRTMIEDFIDDCLPKKDNAPYEIAWNYTKCYHLKLKERRNRDKNLHYLSLFY